MEATPANQAGQPDVNQVSGRTAPECATPTRATPREDASAAVLPEAPVLEEQGEEIDVWWGSYAARTLTPSFILCGLFTLVVLGVALYLGALHGTTLPRDYA